MKEEQKKEKKKKNNKKDNSTKNDYLAFCRACRQEVPPDWHSNLDHRYCKDCL